MSDHTSLNEPDLLELERCLRAVSLSPSSPRREHLLYACGQAAGRAEVGRRLRRMSIVAASLTCVSAALCVALFMNDAVPPQHPVSHAESVANQRNIALRSDSRLRERVKAQDTQRHLTAGTRYERMLAIDRDQPGERVQGGAVDLTSPQVLTPLGGPALEELWN